MINQVIMEKMLFVSPFSGLDMKFTWEEMNKVLRCSTKIYIHVLSFT